MAKELDYSHMVQAYFDNEMSMEERMDFEQLIDKDPSLQQEFQLQKDIIDGIRKYRSAEIKAHLATVPVGGFVWTAALRWAVGGSSLALLSALSYFFIIPTLPESYSEVDLSSGLILELSDTNKVPVRPAITAQQTEEPKETEATTVELPSYEAPARQNTPPTKEFAPVAESTVATPLPNPVVNIPTLTEPEEVASNTNLEAPGAVFFDRTEEPKKTEVEFVEEKRYNFHYQFYNFKLYLYGDFGGKIYEIIELNDHESRRFYLYFQETFYPIEPGEREIKKLTAIEDQALIQQLELARQSSIR